ncbi:kinesin-like protein KIF17 isoform X4 [Rhineura floridana]|uniref:kinesin-like protein KIF17 isoform X4 n=1 Tax=Rhineura floridana TaxID=261503 RepID=UPI002AC88163|nr:kinesin-like protein KIF17 isoform X4 [Rhineura floridana]
MASEAVKVIVRCRPLNEREKQLGCKVVVNMDSSRGQCFIQNPVAAEDPPKQFTFDGAYNMNHNTEQIYNEIAYPLIEGVTEGYNGTIFAYGQTGSGKSFTMQGILDPSSQKGIIPRAFEHLFESVQCAENTKFLVRASYLEIYNEDIRDLLGSNTKQKLELKEHPEKGVYVKGLSLHTVHSIAQCERIMETGWRNRAVGYTLMNKDSSRSHSIFTINMEIYVVVELSHLLPSEAAQPEVKLEPSLESLADIEKEKQLIREEYEERLARLKADYEAEQESRVRLEEDISALRSAYDMKFCSFDENLRKEAETTQLVEAIANQAPLLPGPAGETEVSAKEPNTVEPPAPLGAQPMEKAMRPGTPGTDVAEELPVAVNQQQVLARLQMLEQQVVGGEQAKNKDLKEKHKRRKKIADERKKQLLAALQKSDEDSSDWVLLNVYDSIQEEVRAKSKLLEKMKEKLRAAETEIKDLQSEFEMEKIDYLATIRRQERELLLYQQLLDQVQPLIRRDCNYSNFDKIKRESTWDEESGCWKIPEPVTQKTSLPAAVSSLSQTKAGRKSSSSENGDAVTMQEEDRYKVMLSKSDSENIASNYFRSKRASQILNADPMKSLASHNSPPLLNNSTSILTSSLTAPAQTVEMPQPRPFRLESLDFSSPSAKTKRKKSRNNLSSGDPL